MRYANELCDEQTPGGLNEQILREMTEAGAYAALNDSLDGALARIEGQPLQARSSSALSSLFCCERMDHADAGPHPPSRSIGDQQLPADSILHSQAPQPPSPVATAVALS